MKKILNNKFWLPIILCLLFLINWAASQFRSRIDLTSEKRFTLSEPTKKVLKKIDEPIAVDVFLKGSFPAGFRQLASSTNDILREFKEIAGHKIQYNFINPDDVLPNTETKYADTLMAMGLYPINLTSQLKEGQQQQNVYPFAWVHYKDKSELVELYKSKIVLRSDNDYFKQLISAEALLEYELIEPISKLLQKEKPKLGFAIGNGEPTNFTTYDLVENILKKDYDFSTIDLNTIPVLPAVMNALIIVKPTLAFSDIEKLKLDQYVMNGGKIILFVDRLNAEMDSLQSKKGEVTAFDRDLKLNDILFNYGARINADLLMDLQCDVLPFDVNGNGQFELLPWNYFPVLEGNAAHAIGKGLGFVAGQFTNSIDTVTAEGIQKTVLLHSSTNARTISSPAIISASENVNAPEDAKFKKANIPVAVLLEGKFKSFFFNRLSQAMNDSLKNYNQSFLPQCISNNKMIVVSDGDIVLNAVAKGNAIPMGMNKYTIGTQREFPFANVAFAKNCLSYLINESGLSDAKAKDYRVRLLDSKKVEAQKVFWQIINIVLPISIVLLFAIIFQWLRKRKYHK